MDTDLELTALTEDERSILKVLGDAVLNTLGGEQALLDQIAEKAEWVNDDQYAFGDFYDNDSDDPVGVGEYRASVALRLDWLSASGSECDAVELMFPEDEYFNDRYRAAESNLIARRWLYLEDGDLIFGNRKMWEWYLGRRIDIEAAEPGDEEEITDPYRIFPQATENQRAELKRSIEAVGLQNPLVVDEKKNVIDGHDRRDVCFELGIDWMAGADVRIGLNGDQKKALAVDLNMWRKPLHLTREKRNELIDIYLIAQPELSETQVAELFGVNQSTINRRKNQLMQTHKLPPVQATVGKDGVRRKIGDRGARMTVKSEREYDSLVPDIAEVGDDLKGIIRRPNSVASTAKRKREQAEVSNLALSVPASLDSIRLYHCPFQKLESVAGIAPDSAQLVCTDIPYDRSFLPQVEELGKLAERVLVEGGYFVTYCGQYWLPRVIELLEKSLTYRWTKASFWDADATPVHVGKTRVVSKWKPILIYSKGNVINSRQWHDVSHVNSKEKQWHPWQQPLAEVEKLVEDFSAPDDLVLDPCGGGFTTAIASLNKNRRFVGCDIEQHNVAAGQERLRLINESSACQDTAKSG